WRPALAGLGSLGLVMAAVIFLFTPRFPRDVVAEAGPTPVHDRLPPQSHGFGLLLAIGILDSAVRMGFLLFVPFVLKAKGASLQDVGLAMTLIFAGGAAGKLACAFLGARIGAVATVWVTETATALGMAVLLKMPLEFALLLLPLVGIALNGTSSVLYGSVPDLVEPERRARAFGIFYTGTIGAGAI